MVEIHVQKKNQVLEDLVEKEEDILEKDVD